MATGGGGDGANQTEGELYNRLQKEKESHQYQRLVNIANIPHRPTLPPITNLQREKYGHTGFYNGLDRLKPDESQTRYVNLHSHSNKSLGNKSRGAEYYNTTAVTPLGPQKVDDFSGATSVRYVNDEPGREHTGDMLNYYKEKPVVHHHQEYSANSVFYNDYSKPHYPGAVKYTNNPGVEHVDWVTDDNKHQEENNMYEEIPADEGRPSSRRSLRSNSSIEPILPVAEDSVSVQKKSGRRVIILVGLIIAVLVVIAVVVAVAVVLSRKDKTDGSRSEENKKDLGTTILTTMATTVISTGTTSTAISTSTNGTTTAANAATPTMTTPSTGTRSSTSTSGTTSTESAATPTTTTPSTGTISTSGTTSTESAATPTMTTPSTGITSAASSTSTIGDSATSTASAVPTTSTLKPALIPGHTYFMSTLVVVDHPRDKVRLKGDSVTICCLATGSPSPVFYDWYKDDILLEDHRQDTNLSSSLHLIGLTTSDTGHYSCKANNTQSMVLSDSAWLEVRETESFCPTTPEEYLVPLPTGCTYNGNTVYNQGYCPSAPCRGPSSPDTEHCLDFVQYCCGPISYEPHTINCGDHVYEIYTINQCGCTTCDKPLDSIVGIAQTLDGTTRFSYGHIYLRNTSTTSNDRFGTSGIFEVELENNAHRLVLLTDNIYDHKTFYNQSSHVIHLTNTLTGSQYLSADVRYIVKSSENSHTSQDIYKEFTLMNGSPFLTLEMEHLHYHTMDNIPYNESIDISVNFISGEDVEALQATAGDFMFIGGEGRARHLMAYGAFVIELVGNDAPVYYNHTIIVTVMGDHFTNISQTRLWRLGDSGYWHVEDRLGTVDDVGSKNKYQAHINGLHFATTWFAIARADEWDTCFTKVRLFQGDSSIAGSQQRGATVKIILTYEDGSGLVASTRADTDRNDNNGYCIAHPCDAMESFNVYAKASYEGHLLKNTSTENSVDNNITITKASGLHNNNNGATYKDSKDCSMAGITTDKYIAFRRETCETDINVVSQPLSFGTSVCHPELYQAWHSAQEQALKSYKSCHIKILAPNLVGVTFEATSINTVESSTVESGRLYGVRQDCVISKGVVCLQIKSGGTINCNNGAENELTDVTNITISSLGNSAKVSEIDATLTRNFKVGSELGDNIFQFSFPGDSYGIYYGIFCAQGASPETARWRSKRYCLSGKERDSEIRMDYITPQKYAVKFE